MGKAFGVHKTACWRELAVRFHFDAPPFRSASPIGMIDWSQTSSIVLVEASKEKGNGWLVVEGADGTAAYGAKGAAGKIR
jgi:hypothetical protein